MRKCLYLYGLLLIFGVLISMLLPGWITSPISNFTTLIQSSRRSSGQTIFKSRAGYLKFLPKSYILVLYSGNEADFQPAEYIIITKLNSDLSVELMEGAGPQNVRVLKNLDAEIYLNTHGIDLSDLNKELQRRNTNPQ